MSKLLIQKIHTQWTKKSRGGQSAAHRSAVPDLFPLQIPSEPVKDDLFARHHIGCDEWNNFVPQYIVETRKISYLLHHECLEVELRDGVCKVFYVHRPERVRALIRGHSGYPKNVATLLPGEWCQVIFNGRTTIYDTGEWCYNKMVYNCFSGDLIALSNSFPSNGPKCCKKDLSHLW